MPPSRPDPGSVTTAAAITSGARAYDEAPTAPKRRDQRQRRLVGYARLTYSRAGRTSARERSARLREFEQRDLCQHRQYRILRAQAGL